MDSDERQTIAERALALSDAAQTEVMVSVQNNALTRFTHNAIHQNVADADVAVKVRAIVGSRTGVASTNILDDAALRDVVARAVDMAKLAPEDPLQPPLPGPGRIVPAEGAFCEQTARATPQMRAEMADEIFKAAIAHDCWAAGFVTTSSGGVTILNSSGARASFDGTDSGINVKMSAQDSSGFAEAYDTDVTRLDARALGERAAQKARDSASPIAVEPGEYTVILEPPAFGELFMYLASHFSAQAFDEKWSFLSDGLNKKYFGDNVEVVDDYAHPLAPGMTFDYEGHPTQRLTLVENGVGRSVVTDAYWASKLHRENTGHALPAPNPHGPQALHLVVAHGSKSVNELVAQTKRGLLISRFWYIRTVDQKKAIVTGMTRDGTFLIEDGRIARGVRNMRFNQSLIEALKRCEFGNALHRTGSYSYSVVVPSAKIEGFTFSSGTDF